jgi:hypothetical protein
MDTKPLPEYDRYVRQDRALTDAGNRRDAARARGDWAAARWHDAASLFEAALAEVAQPVTRAGALHKLGCVLFCLKLMHKVDRAPDAPLGWETYGLVRAIREHRPALAPRLEALRGHYRRDHKAHELEHTIASLLPVLHSIDRLGFAVDDLLE